MHFDPDHDDSIADDLCQVIERANAERRHALAAVLGAAWLAIHDGTTHRLAEALQAIAEDKLIRAADIGEEVIL